MAEPNCLEMLWNRIFPQAMEVKAFQCHRPGYLPHPKELLEGDSSPNQFFQIWHCRYISLIILRCGEKKANSYLSSPTGKSRLTSWRQNLSFLSSVSAGHAMVALLIAILLDGVNLNSFSGESRYSLIRPALTYASIASLDSSSWAKIRLGNSQHWRNKLRCKFRHNR